MCFNFEDLDNNLKTSFNRVKDDVHFLMKTKKEHETLVFKMETEHNKILIKLNKLSDIPQRVSNNTSELNKLKNMINSLRDSFARLNKNSLTVKKFEVSLKNTIANFNKNILAVNKKFQSKDSSNKKELTRLKAAYLSVKKENSSLLSMIKKMQNDQKKMNARILADLKKQKTKSIQLQPRKTPSRSPTLNYDLESVKGIGKKYAGMLKNIYIKNVKQLLEEGRTDYGRKNIAASLKISKTIVLEWVNRIDLMRINGIGTEYSDLLEDCGVDTVIELRTRNPDNLLQKLTEVNSKRKLVKLLPGLNDIKKWISQAKRLKRAVEY